MKTYDFLLKDKDHNLDFLRNLALKSLISDFSLIERKLANCKNKQELIAFCGKLEKLGILK